jgi:hypothetical protein
LVVVLQELEEVALEAQEAAAVQLQVEQTQVVQEPLVRATMAV